MYALNTKTNNKDNEDNDNKNQKCIGTTCSFLAIGIPTFVLIATYMDNPCAAVNIPGTRIDMRIWFITYGSVLGAGTITVWLNTCYEGLKKICNIILSIIGLFMLTWNIILCVAFATILSDCKDSGAKPLYNFGYALVIIFGIASGLMFLGKATRIAVK